MKRLTQKTNKWILSGLLLSALGSQYYYSVSSNNVNIAQFPISTEHLIRLPAAAAASPAAPAVAQADTQKVALAKKAARLNEVNARLKEIEKTLKANPPAHLITELNNEKQKLLTEKKQLSSDIQKAKGKAPVTTAKNAKIRAVADGADDVVDDEVVAPEPAAKPAAAPAPAVAVAASAPAASADPNMINKDQSYSLSCTTCGNSKPMNLNAEQYQRVLDFLNGKSTEQKSIGDTKVKDNAPEGETAAEKRIRLAEEKAEKLKEELEARNEEFLEKAEEIALKCDDDLECKVDRFKSLMEKYSGSKKVAMYVVTKSYNQLINKDLISGLNNEKNMEGKIASNLALRSLMDNLPTEYSSLKIRAIESVKAVQTAQAQEVTKVLKHADSIAKTNPNESLAIRQQGLTAMNQVKSDSDIIQKNMLIGINSSQDRSTLEYIKSQYLPDISSVLNQMLGITTAPTTANQPTVTPTPNSPNPGTTIPGGTSGTGTSTNGRAGRGGAAGQGNVTGGTNTIIGAPTTILPAGGRTGRNYGQ